jgi:glutathione synthase/RimK-type ligase-like ATP-grasp enzyme
MFERVVAESAKDNLRYHVFGVDVLPKASGDVMLVECNIYPNMIQAAGAMVANDAMVRSVLRLLFGVLKGGGEVDDELSKVWTMPR